MEQFRDTSKTAKQAKPVQDLIAGFNYERAQLESFGRHDHTHMEDGVLVEDTPPEPSVDGRDLGGVALNRWCDQGNYMDVDL